MMKIFKEWEIINIDLSKDDDKENYKNKSKKFLDSLIKQYELHIKNLDSANENDEIKEIKSPMTLFNGSWGSGKTFFIKNFEKYFNDIYLKKTKKQTNNNGFEKIIYINALDLLDDEKIIYEFLYSLFQKIEKLKNITRKSANILFKLGINSIIGIINGNGTAQLKNLELKNDKDENINLTKKLKLKKTIIFIYNLERIGNDSKKIIQLIYKLRRLENLFFVLITNINKLVDYDSIDKNEYHIYKFINTKVFNFKQDYISIIQNPKLNKNNIKFKKDELSLINSSLNKNNNGKQLTIREFERWLNSNNFFDEINEINRILKINEIDYVDIKKDFTKIYDSEINKYLEYLKEINNIFNLLKNEYIRGEYIAPYEDLGIDNEGYVRKISNYSYIKKENKNELRLYRNYGENNVNNLYKEIENNYWLTNYSYDLNQTKQIALKKDDLEIKYIYFDDDEILKDDKNDQVKKSFLNYKDYSFVPYYLKNYKDEVKNDFNNYVKYKERLEKKFKNLDLENKNLNKSVEDKKLLNKKLLSVKKIQNEIEKLEQEKKKHHNDLKKIDETNFEKIAIKERVIELADKKLNELNKKYSFDEDISEKIKENRKFLSQKRKKIRENKKTISDIKSFLKEWDLDKIKELTNEILNKIKEIEKNINKNFILDEKVEDKLFINELINDEKLFKENLINWILKIK